LIADLYLTPLQFEVLIDITVYLNTSYWQHVQWNAFDSGISVTYLGCRGTNKLCL